MIWILLPKVAWFGSGIEWILNFRFLWIWRTKCCLFRAFSSYEVSSWIMMLLRIGMPADLHNQRQYPQGSPTPFTWNWSSARRAGRRSSTTSIIPTSSLISCTENCQVIFNIKMPREMSIITLTYSTTVDLKKKLLLHQASQHFSLAAIKNLWSLVRLLTFTSNTVVWVSLEPTFRAAVCAMAT